MMVMTSRKWIETEPRPVNAFIGAAEPLPDPSGFPVGYSLAVGDIPRTRIEVTIPEPWHGTVGGYKNHGCRCDRCREAHRIAQRDYRDRHPERDRRVRRDRMTGLRTTLRGAP